MSGIVYCLTNQAMPNYVKIGRTDNLVARLQQLDNTSVPLPFECVFAVQVEDPVSVERLLHQAFADHRQRSNREFFTVSPLRVIAAMQLTSGTDVTPGKDIAADNEGLEALKEARTRRANFNFELVGIPAGADLYFLANADDAPEHHATVIDARRIQFGGQAMSLSAAAGQILASRGLSSNVAGTEYWYYDSESLADRRRRLEEAD